MNCPICGKPLMQLVQIFVWCPASEDVFNKTALKKPTMKISAVRQPEPEKWICETHGTLRHIWETMPEFKE